jgi:hypothetical protein
MATSDGGNGEMSEARDESQTDGDKAVWDLEKRIHLQTVIRNLAFIFLIGVFPTLIAALWALDGSVGVTFAAVTGYLELVAVLVFLVSRLRLRDLQAELRTAKFENEIRAEYGESPMLLFLKHQAELKRYYDQALQQSGLAFALGVFCIISGLAAIAAGFMLIHDGSDVSDAERIVTGALAAVGAILSGFVAKVYLGIHHGAIHSLTGFHEKFVETHHLHIAGVFASRVDDEEKRDAALLALVEAAAASAPSA